MQIVRITNCHWQTVPHVYPVYRESSVAKFYPHAWNRIVSGGCRVEPMPRWIIITVGVHGISQVLFAFTFSAEFCML